MGLKDLILAGARSLVSRSNVVLDGRMIEYTLARKADDPRAAALMSQWRAKDYDANWFVRFLQLADEEDFATVSSGGDWFKNHAWFNIAVSLIARNCARPPFTIYQGKDALEEESANPLVRLFSRPNPTMSGSDLWEATVSWKKITGEAIWVFEPDFRAGRLPSEIHPVNPRQFKHITDPSGRFITLWKWEYTTQAGRVVSVPFLPDELVHFKEWNPWNPHRGICPLVAAADEIGQDLHANRANTNMLNNSSMPEGLLASDKPLTLEQARQLREQWEAQHRGSAKSHRIAVLGYGTQFQKVQLSPKEMEYLKMKTWNRSTILARLGVQPAVTGIKDEYTPLSGKDTGEQMREFWNVTLIPELKGLNATVRIQFMERFGLAGYRTGFDLNAIQELQEDEDKLASREREDVKLGITKINEVRSRRRQEPVEWGDTWWRPFSVVPAETPVVDPTAPRDDEGNGNGAGRNPANGERNVTPLGPRLEALTKAPLRSIFPAAVREAHWRVVMAGWDTLEDRYAGQIAEWMFEERSRELSLIAERWKVAKDGESTDLVALILAEEAWAALAEQFAALTTEIFSQAAELTEEALAELFGSLGIEQVFSLADTEAARFLSSRVNRVKGIVTSTLRSEVRAVLEQALTGGWDTERTAASIRTVFNVGKARARDIARTELGGAYNDAREAGFKWAGFTHHSWLTARDSAVRDSHRIDGEVVAIGEKFSNGLYYPHDPEAPVEEVVNCRCLTMPEGKR